MINFNKPYLTGKEAHYMYQAVLSGKISGNGIFTQKCQAFFEERYQFNKCLLTNSCTDALEMASILSDIKQGDEVIVPSYTFVSTANAFVLRGAKIIFADSLPDQPCLDVEKLESLITLKTKVIVPVHYAGVSCDMDRIMEIASKHELLVIEDAAQAVDSYYTNKTGCKRPLGSIGHLAAFSFHETKNIISGEGGMLVINEEKLKKRAEIIWEKGTNRSSFFRGEVDKYGWMDVGSSFLPSEVTAAFLYAQLEHLELIQDQRRWLWNRYYEGLNKSKVLDHGIRLPYIPSYATNNAHMFYIICESQIQRSFLIENLKIRGIQSVFHYISLHNSEFSIKQGFNKNELHFSDLYTDRLLRLPLFFELKESEVDFIVRSIIDILGDSN